MRQYTAFLVLIVSALTIQAQTFSNGQAARAVLGQQNFTAGVDAPSQTFLGGVSGLAFYNGNLYVADSNRVAAVPQDSRIMVFPTAQIPGVRDNLQTAGLTNGDCYLCGFPASFSLGQSTFTPSTAVGCQPGENSCFTVSRTQSGLANATGVATDGHYFAVADTDNNRVLIWNSLPTSMNQPANIVLGQTGFTTFKSPQVVDRFSLRGPQAVWIQNNRLYVADTQNNRVLIWNSIPTQNNQAADVVLGQNDFTHNTQPPPNSGNPVAAANQLLNPTSVTADATHLFISDLGFNRVLIWNSFPTTNAQPADVVVGQPDMTQTASNNVNVCNGYAIGPVSECQTSLNYPRFALSNGTKLFVADGGNDRVLIWDTIPTTNGVAATGVLGEPDFIQDVVSSATISIASTAIDNTGGVDLLPTPQALAYDPATQNLYVSDPYNRRVVIFTPGDNPLAPNSIVNWASEIVRQEGIVSFTIPTSGVITASDTASITIAGGTPYVYTEKAKDGLDDIAKGLVALINAGTGDANVTAIFEGTGTGTLYLSSKATDLPYDSISIAATTSNTANVAATASGSYLSSGTAATGAIGMIVEINGTNLSDQTLTANLDGVALVPTDLGGVQVYMDGFSCPLFSVSPTQIVTQIPYNYSDRNSTSVFVRTMHNDGSVTVTTAMPVYIAPANPGIFNAPAYAGQVRPWPISMAFHQAGNSTAVVSVDGSITAKDTATITIAGTAYTYTIVATDTLTTVTQNLVNLINASDPNVTASVGAAFTRVVLTAKQAGAAGDGISVAGSASTTAAITLTAYNSVTCCVVTPNSLITTANPAAPGELIQVSSAGLGIVTDPTGVAQYSLNTGHPYSGPGGNSAFSFVTATLGGVTAQVISAGLNRGSYGIYDVQMIVPTTLTASAAVPLYMAQNAFISNTVTIPVGPPALLGATTPTPTSTAPATAFSEVIDAPAAGATVSGTIFASGWALSSATAISAVNLFIDGRLYSAAIIHNNRPDVCAIYSSPDCPNTGWSVAVDTTQFADGRHSVSITAVGVNGTNYSISQSFFIQNSGSPATSSLRASIDVPGANYSYRGVTNFSGWATNDNSPVAGVSIYIDGAPQGPATYGSARPDVCAIFTNPPNCPNVGWSFQIDTNKLGDGSHTLSAKSVSTSGQTYAISQVFSVANWNGQGTTHATIDAPSAGAGVFSGFMVAAGWAVDDKSAISAIYINVDGVSYGKATYGVSRPDVCGVYSDAGCPNVGWGLVIDTTYLADGQHTLGVIVIPAAGASQTSTYTRTFTVANQATAANPINAVIDAPAPNTTVSGTFNASGWALSAVDSVSTVALLIDGQAVRNAAYGSLRPDVCVVYPGQPGCPNVGWTAPINTSALANGSHVIEATVTTAQGHRASVSNLFVVQNATTGPGRILFDNPGVSSDPFLGLALFKGSALNDNSTVTGLSVTIDGVPYGAATYGLPRPDVCASYPGRPNCPNVGWTFGIDTGILTDGTHALGITETLANGTVYSASQPFTVANYSVANPMRILIDSPANTTAIPIFGTIAISGWAIDDYSLLTGVNIAIDGQPLGAAYYGQSRPDVCTVFSGRQGCPNVGWVFSYDTTLIPNGIHTINVTGVTVTGQTSTLSEQVSIAN